MASDTEGYALGSGGQAVASTPQLKLKLTRAGQNERAPDHVTARSWALTFTIVLGLAVDGGGYTIASYGEVGIAIWWAIVALACGGVLLPGRLTRAALASLVLLAAFVGWTALATTWSISSGRSLQDLSLVVCFLGVFALGVLIHRDRERALRGTTGALATAVTLVALLALASRFFPGLFPASRLAGNVLTGTRSRLSWPLDYWNALAALMDLGLPLLLAIATSARTVRAQAAATAAVPVVALCAVLTLSRDGAAAGLIAVGVFLCLAPDRLPKLATSAIAAAGSAVVVVAALRRHAVQQALVGHVESHQAVSLILVILLTCAGVGALQAALARSTRRGVPSYLRVPVRRARWLTAVAVVAFVVLAIGLRVPHRLDHAWASFKHGQVATSQNSISHFGTTSGEGRYQYWKVAIDSLHGHVLTGSGPGTFQLLWLPKAPFDSYVINAHSLYIETLAEEGVVGIALLAGFFAVVLVAGLRQIASASRIERVWLAGAWAAMVGFLVFAAFDWIWQVAVLPAAFLLLAAAVVAPRRGPTSRAHPKRRDGPSSRVGVRLGILICGIACLVATIVPLATSNALSASESAASAGHRARALEDARRAVAAEPGSAPAWLQVALVLEEDHDFSAATAAARRAVKDEPANWSNWLTLSRLEAEDGNARAALGDYERARSLNPRSVLFS